MNAVERAKTENRIATIESRLYAGWDHFARLDAKGAPKDETYLRHEDVYLALLHEYEQLCDTMPVRKGLC